MTTSTNLILILLLPAVFMLGQDWPVYGGDAGGTRYSPLKEINRSNVAKLKTAWTYQPAMSAMARISGREARSKRRR